MKDGGGLLADVSCLKHFNILFLLQWTCPALTFDLSSIEPEKEVSQRSCALSSLGHSGQFSTTTKAGTGSGFVPGGNIRGREEWIQVTAWSSKGSPPDPLSSCYGTGVRVWEQQTKHKMRCKERMQVPSLRAE